MSSLTTIGNLYDILIILFTKMDPGKRHSKDDLMRIRPSDEDLNYFLKQAENYFNLMGKSFTELNRFFTNKNYKLVVKRNRGNHGGSALFRPLGLMIFTEILAKLASEISLEDAFKLVAKLPTKLNAAPYKDLMWNSSTRTIVGGHNVTLREVLLHMIGHSTKADILTRYHNETGNEKIKLPKSVI